MGIKGQVEYKKWESGKELNIHEAVEANCYICNGGEAVDCRGAKSCPMYKYFPYKNKTRMNKGVSEGEK